MWDAARWRGVGWGSVVHWMVQWSGKEIGPFPPRRRPTPPAPFGGGGRRDQGQDRPDPQHHDTEPAGEQCPDTFEYEAKPDQRPPAMRAGQKLADNTVPRLCIVWTLHRRLRLTSPTSCHHEACQVGVQGLDLPIRQVTEPAARHIRHEAKLPIS